MKTITASRVKRIIVTLFGVCLIWALLFAFRPMRVSAATKTVKKQKFTTSYSVANKKAATVKKGTTTLKGSVGYIKFTAPKTATYKFTFSNMKTVGVKASEDGNFAYIMVMHRDGNYVFSGPKVSTAGGKTDTLHIATKKWGDAKKTTSAYLATRTGKVRLKKGQVVFMYISMEALGNKKSTVKLTIK